MAVGRNPEELSLYTGYAFKDSTLLATALTHSSYTNECRREAPVACNERLEFLGDAVLQIVISDYLFLQYKNSPEGDLTNFRKHLVCEETLARLARKIHLGEFLILGKGEEQNGGRDRVSLLADAFEALVAALYLDDGRSTEFLQVFLFGLAREELASCERHRSGDYKTRLQQFVQQDGREQLSYTVVSETGPDHDKVFEVCAMLNSNEIGRGKGRSKREAEQIAAREALLLFGVADDE